MFAPSRRSLPSLGLLLLAACEASPGTDVVDITREQIGLSNTHLYLRCNATGFALTNANRLRPTAGGRVATLTFQVTESWMVQNGDTCIITETDVLNGWSSNTKSWTTGSQLNAPDTKNLSESWNTFIVRFPSTGTFRAIVDRTANAVTIARPGTWLQPFDGAPSAAWVVGSFVDHNPAALGLDYAGGSRVVDQHAGTDYAVGSFRAMDNGLRITAVAPGVVTRAIENHFDRVTEEIEDCFNKTNLVEVRHTDGTVVTYAHLKRNSVTVNVGQTVSAGQTLGVVGSSGCTSGPHLHLEARTPPPGNAIIDPFKLGLWAQPLPYGMPLSIIDVALVNGFVQDSHFSDPPPNATTFHREEPIGTIAWAGGGMAGDVLTIRVINPSGGVYDSVPIEYTGTAGQGIWAWHFCDATELGPWKAEFLTNGVVARTVPFNVVP
jgi:murein DD-endopeptidase MepM/ murein hydrolase activator NlpD